MNNLIVSQNQTLTMGTREVAKLLDKNHSDIKRSAERLVNSGALNNGQPLAECEFTTKMGNVFTEYLLKKRDCLILVAQNSPKFTAAIVDRWQELESKQAPQLPQSFAEALQLAADQAKQLELAAPKVEFHDKIVNDEKTFSFRDAAKKIQQRPNKLIEWLRDNGYLCLNNIAKQQYITQGLFATHTGVSDAGHHYTQCRVTSKGLSYFTSKLGDKKL